MFKAKPLTSWDILEKEIVDAIHRMLIRLEGLAVEMAAPKLTKKDIRELHKINSQLKKLASTNNYLNYLTLNNSGLKRFSKSDLWWS